MHKPDPLRPRRGSAFVVQQPHHQGAVTAGFAPAMCLFLTKAYAFWALHHPRGLMEQSGKVKRL